MRGEIFTGEKCSQAGQRGSLIKPGDFEIQNTSMNESLKPTLLIRMNAVLNSSCMVITYRPLEEGGHYSLNLLNDDSI